MDWFYAIDGIQTGPVPEATLRGKITAGEVKAGDLVWNESMRDWTPAQHAGLGIIFPIADGQIPTGNPYASPVVRTAPHPGAFALRRTSGLAIASLVCGILGMLCFYIFMSVPAIILGHMALGEIRRSGNILEGRGLAIAGLVMGYFMTVVCLCFLIIVIIGAFASSRP